jgi:hypothetical protein
MTLPDMRSESSILFLCMSPPAKSVAGAPSYNFGIIRTASQIGLRTHVVIIDPRLGKIIESSDAELSEFASISFINRVKIGKFYVPTSAKEVARFLLGRIRRRYYRSKSTKSVPVNFGSFINNKNKDKIHNLIKYHSPTWVFYDTIFSSTALKIPTDIFNVLIAHDVYHQRSDSFSKNGFRVETSISADDEAGLIDQFQAVATISDHDKDLLGSLRPDAVIETVWPTIPAPAGEPSDGSPDGILFMGANSYHNRDAIDYFLADIFPLILKDEPEATLHIVGTVSDHVRAGEWNSQFPPGNLVVHGRISDLTSLLPQIGLAINPVRVGSGLKIKMAEYFSLGLGCITTPAGAQGFPRTTDNPFLVEATAETFASTTVDHLRNIELRNNLSKIALRYADAFSLKSSELNLTAILSRIEGNKSDLF